MFARRCLMSFAATVMLLVLGGCGLPVPSDPDGSLDAIRGGTLRAGASLESGLLAATGGGVSGPLADLVEGFAERNGAAVEWTVGSEESLVTGLEEGRLHVAVGGMTTKSPWAPRAGMTRGYRQIRGADGREIVLLVPLGENRLLSALETYLDQELG
jgi:ABC-type amino acid transport substrate-binding protein